MGNNTHLKENNRTAAKAQVRPFLPLGSADKATLFLRLFIGAILFTQAITMSQEYMWLEGEYPSILGLSAAEVVSLVGIVEVVAGVMITVGFLTRLTSAVMAVMMLGAALFFFPHQSFAEGELKVVYAGIYVTLLISGGGRYSFDALLLPLWNKKRG